MDGQFAGERVAAARRFDGIKVADNVRNGHVWRGQLFHEALLAREIIDSCGVTTLLQAERAGMADRLEGIVIDLAAREEGDLFVEQADERPQNATLGLAAQTEQNEIMPGEDSIADLRHHAVVVTDDPRENGIIAVLVQTRNQVVAQLIFDSAGAKDIFRKGASAQFAERSRETHRIGLHKTNNYGIIRPQESASGRRSRLWNSMLFAEHRHLSYVLRSPTLATARSDHREHRQRFQRTSRHEQALHIRSEIRWIDKKPFRRCEAEVVWHQPFEKLTIFEFDSHPQALGTRTRGESLARQRFRFPKLTHKERTLDVRKLNGYHFAAGIEKFQLAIVDKMRRRHVSVHRVAVDFPDDHLLMSRGHEAGSTSDSRISSRRTLRYLPSQ